MTGSTPEIPDKNPFIEAIRQAQENILAASENLSPEEALRLGRGWIRSRLEFSVSERVKGPIVPLIDQQIAQFRSLLGLHKESELGDYLRAQADTLSSDSTWMNSVGPAMEEFPGKLRTIAKMIPHD